MIQQSHSQLVPVTAGSFSLCLWELRDTVELVGASRDSTGCGAMEDIVWEELPAFFRGADSSERD